MTSSLNKSSDIIGKASLTWTMENFSSTNKIVWGPSFRPSNNRNIFFLLEIFPNHPQSGEVYIYLLIGEAETLNLEYEVSILKHNGEKCYTKNYYWNYYKRYDHSRNPTYFISNLELKNEYVRNDKLTLRCDINLHASPVFSIRDGIPGNSLADKDAVLQDYQSLLESGKLSDIVLLVDDKKEFHVHKLILSARSPVFAAMFEHAETKEAQEGRVTLTDVSVEVCEQFLRYIYSGKIEKLKEYALDLFVVADKYQMKHLKSICEQSLSSSFTSESVVNVLIFADMHNAQDLKQKCIDYITKNSVEVRKSDSWKQLCKSKPELLIDLYADMSNKAKF